MNMYKEIDQETMELLLDALLKRTLEGKLLLISQFVTN